MKEMRELVRERYGEIARNRGSCCGSVASCCGTDQSARKASVGIGYSMEEIRSVPPDANLGLGCGNPTALASLKEGEVVLDLGSGGGFDCFLAAQKVGKGGRVIGVDMTPEMVGLARKNAAKGNDSNVEFRLGEIENLPVADQAVDVVISNCVINLSPQKSRVFEEAYRVLKTGGRFMISDIVLLKPLPRSVQDSIEAYVGCIGGAMVKDDYLNDLKAAGFADVKVAEETPFNVLSFGDEPFVRSMADKLGLSREELCDISDSIVSIRVEGRKSPC
ncbi:MAG: arsenite methyltransferase [Thermodesulfobacteriota bacterium]